MRALPAAALLLTVSAVPSIAAESVGAPAGVMALVHADRWVEADIAAARVPDPVARKLVAFYRLLAPYSASVAEIDAFRAANPDWPLQAVLTRRREEAIVAEPDDSAAVAACVREEPREAAALLRCAEGAARRNRPDLAETDARAAWIAAAPNPRWEAAFLRRWGQAIGPLEQWRRFDRLAWSDTAGAAAQVSRLTPGDQPRAEARLAFRRDDPQAASLLAGLPPEQRTTPPMLLEHARWLRRGGRYTDALALWRQAGAAAEAAAPDPRRPAFWDERNRLARDLLGRGDPNGAYALAAGAAQTGSEQVADAAFLAGWIALRRLEQPALAERHFAALAAVSRAAITQARAHYWLARAAATSGDPRRARREYALAAAYPSTFYGQLAALASGGDPARLSARIEATRDPQWSSTQAAAFATGELARASAWLVGWGEPGRAAAFLLRLSDLARSAPQQALAARLATGYAMPQTAVALARLAGRDGLVLLDTGWPVAAPITPGSAVDPALALGIMRQESSFDPAIVSPAGARGLMQLLPSTAAGEARRLGLPVSAAALTADPAYNVAVGTAYLGRLLARFGGAAPLAAAGYNAGPSRVASWLAANGDPQSNAAAMIDWIELIPFSETRNYVQRVIENTVIYQAKLGEAAAYPMPWQHAPA